MSDDDRIDWGLIFVLTLMTLIGFLAGASAALRSSLKKVEAAERELRACHRALIVYEARGVGIRSEARPPGSRGAPRGTSPTPSARLVAPGADGFTYIRRQNHAL